MRRLTIALLTALLVVLAGCSGTADPEPAGSPSEVTVSTPPDTPSPTPTPSETSADFDTAVEFTETVHTADSDRHSAAAEFVKPESPAARYLAHQTLVTKAEVIAGIGGDEESSPTVKADPKTQSVKISFPAEEAAEGQSATKAFSYTWKDFTFDQGKVTGWTGASGPVKDVLWTRQTSDESEGRKAVLKSAYRANNKNVVITVELSSTVATGFNSAEYTAKDGYRQVTLEEYASELSKGEKTLAYYVIEKTEFGGELHIPYTDAEGFDEGELLLTIK